MGVPTSVSMSPILIDKNVWHQPGDAAAIAVMHCGTCGTGCSQILDHHQVKVSSSWFKDCIVVRDCCTRGLIASGVEGTVCGASPN